MEIVPGLHQVKTPMPSPALPYVFAYIFEGKDGISLFDAGYGTPEAIKTLTAELKQLGHEPKDIRRLMISHGHPDHYGMAGWIKKQSPDCEIVMLAREWEWISHAASAGGGFSNPVAFMRRGNEWLVRHGVSRDEVEQAFRDGGAAPPWANYPGGGLLRRLGARVRLRSRLRQAVGRAQPSPGGGMSRLMGFTGESPEPDVKLNDGDLYEFDGWSLQAVWTPGHTPGHLCMYERNHKLMFTGDHVLPHISPNVSLSEEQEGDGSSPLADFRESLRRVATFDVTLGLPAHEYTMPDLPARCEALIQHHDGRLEEHLAAIGNGGATASDISSGVIWNTGPFDKFHVFTKRAAMGETLSHLKLLLDEGQVTRHDDGERVIWKRT